MFIRLCPYCSKTIPYKNQKGVDNANFKKAGCKSCTWKKHFPKEDKSSEVFRECPKCHKTIVYGSNYSMKSAEYKNSICRPCASSRTFKDMHNEVREGKRLAPFSGKTHSEENRKKHSDFMKNEFREGRYDHSGKNNPMYGKTSENFLNFCKKTYVERFGYDRSQELKQNLSNKTAGKNNAMYGKPSPRKSGSGVKGYYKDWWFRSLRELAFMINYIERFNLSWSNGEKLSISYVNYDGRNRTYRPDFIVNKKYLIEVKPKKLHGTPLVILKKNAAIEFCKTINLKYKLIDPIQKIKTQQLLDLIESGQVQVDQRTLTKIHEYDTRSGGL